VSEPVLKPQVDCIRFGEIIQVPMKDGQRERFFVMNNCGHEAVAPSYLCSSHELKLANVASLMEHIEDCRGDTEPCRLVVFCRRHRYFERVSASQQEGFRRAGLCP
jgi:hypothetical protein